MEEEIDLYVVLGVSPTADGKEIRKCYLKLAREVHPDKNPSPEANAQFQRLGHAYSVLGDENKRREYDRMRGRSGSDPFWRNDNSFNARARAREPEEDPREMFNRMWAQFGKSFDVDPEEEQWAFGEMRGFPPMRQNVFESDPFGGFFRRQPSNGGNGNGNGFRSESVTTNVQMKNGKMVTTVKRTVTDEMGNQTTYVTETIKDQNGMLE